MGDMVIRSCNQEGRLVRAGLLLGVTVFVCLANGPVAAETLRDALAAAYKFNPRLDADRARQRAQDEEVARANSGYRPVITGNATAGFSNIVTQPPTTFLSGETHPRTLGVTAVQPLFRGFRVLNGVRGAEAGVRAGREVLRTTEQSVLLDAATAYLDVVRDQAIVLLRENNVNVLTRELKATQDRFSVGEVTRTDVAQAEASRAAAVGALDLARANLKTSRATFERVIGHPPSNLVESREAEKLLPRTLDEAIAISARENPAVVSALYNEAAARYAVEQVWGELLPSVELDASYQRSWDASPGINLEDATTVTGRLSVPFYTGGEVEARVRQAKQTHISRLQQIEQSRTETAASVVAAWSALAAARAALESDQVAVNANEIALAGVREEERVGQRTLLDVLNAEQALLTSQVQLVTDRHNLIVGFYNVLSTVGRLNIQELGGASEVYDSSVHYKEVRRKGRPWDISITDEGRRELLVERGAWQTQTEAEPQPWVTRTERQRSIK
jgi:outer membrane protein